MTSLAPSGPPLVIALTNRNDRLMVLMMKNVSVVRMFVHTSGMVIWKKMF